MSLITVEVARFGHAKKKTKVKLRQGMLWKVAQHLVRRIILLLLLNCLFSRFVGLFGVAVLKNENGAEYLAGGD